MTAIWNHLQRQSSRCGFFLNDWQVGSLIPSQSWLVSPSGPAPVYCGGPDWMIWFLKSDGLDCLRQGTSERGRARRRHGGRVLEGLARWNLRVRKMNGSRRRQKIYVLKKKTNMENVRQLKLDRRQAEAERGTVNLDRLLCFKVDEYGFI